MIIVETYYEDGISGNIKVTTSGDINGDRIYLSVYYDRVIFPALWKVYLLQGTITQTNSGVATKQ